MYSKQATMVVNTYTFLVQQTFFLYYCILLSGQKYLVLGFGSIRIFWLPSYTSQLPFEYLLISSLRQLNLQKFYNFSAKLIKLFK